MPSTRTHAGVHEDSAARTVRSISMNVSRILVTTMATVSTRPIAIAMLLELHAKLPSRCRSTPSLAFAQRVSLVPLACSTSTSARRALVSTVELAGKVHQGSTDVSVRLGGLAATVPLMLMSVQAHLAEILQFVMNQIHSTTVLRSACCLPMHRQAPARVSPGIRLV